METKIWERFRTESPNQLESLKREDVEIFDKDQIKENYTLVVRPDRATLNSIQKITSSLKKIEPDQFYYSLENLCLTIVSNISINTDAQKIVAATAKLAQEYSLLFSLKGLGSNQRSLSVSAYPVEFSLHELREKLGSGNNGDDYTSFLEGYEYLGWINFLRYKQPPSQNFLNKLYQLKDSYLAG